MSGLGGGGVGGTGAGRDATVAQRCCSVGFPAASCLGVCLLAAAAADSGSEINESGVTEVQWDHVRVALATTMLRTSLVRSPTWVLGFALSSLIWLMFRFIASVMMLDSVVILRFIVSSIC